MAEYQTFANNADKIAVSPDEADPELVAKEGIRLSYGSNAEEVNTGIRLLESAAKRGNAEANFRLAQITGKTDKDKALEYYSAAAPGHKDAAMWLGEHYGCQKNAELALKWFRKAQELGRPDAIDAIEEIEEYGDLVNCPQ